jgi:hypothetical protein
LTRERWTRERWTRERCAPLEAAGLFELEKLELVAGELKSRLGKTRAHVNASTPTHLWLVETLGWNRVVISAPIDVNPDDNAGNEPVPDLIVLKRDLPTFDSNPQPQDLALVIEVADSTLIADYWVFDVSGKRFFVHRDPVAGRYSSITIYNEDEAIAPLAAPDSPFRLAEAF